VILQVAMQRSDVVYSRNFIIPPCWYGQTKVDAIGEMHEESMGILFGA
jgi:hypothetical protein